MWDHQGGDVSTCKTCMHWSTAGYADASECTTYAPRDGGWHYDMPPDTDRRVLVMRLWAGYMMSCGSYCAELDRWFVDRFEDGSVDRDSIIAWAELPPCAQRQGE